jgi:carbamoyltransferase
MNYIGISNGFHDAGVSVVDSNGDILFASHSERYSKKKHDENLCHSLIQDVVHYTTDIIDIHYYERPFWTMLRKLIAGQGLDFRTAKHRIGDGVLNQLGYPKVHKHAHHLSHAAAGFQTSPFNDATVVVIDAIGEIDTITIWDAVYDKNGIAKYTKLYNKKYPHSIGLFYSAMTDKVGLKPLDEEYILMGMAAYGSPIHVGTVKDRLIENIEFLNFKENLHIGVPEHFLDSAIDYDIASTAQVIVEELLSVVMENAKRLGKSTNLVYGGGVALNCLANRILGNYFKNIWIMPNPGDCGSSLGAAALGYGKKLNWVNAYLGHNIDGEYPVNGLVHELTTNKIAGVANGRAEFGPRALGNRSLLADPRGSEIKDKVNEIKRRQKFRPFAPVILEEHASDYFNMPSNWVTSRYMQVVASCKYPDLFPAIVHHDGTSRVQTVPNDGTGIRKLLEKWYALTKCPMLLNTSLNIRGEPMVNDRSDADRFEKLYGVKVLS